jgi:large subunit ribosomal protein L23
VTPQQTLKRPIITERATDLAEKFGQVAFEVDVTASKEQIRTAVEAIYGVKVAKVRTLVVPGKLKRRGMSVGKRPNWKKALVTLKKGDVIDFFATE